MMYPIDREEYVNAYLSAMKAELEQARSAREVGEHKGTDSSVHFFEVIAEKLSHWRHSGPSHRHWIPSH